jgi:t-SNARE complex subunit (syntaxin)
VVQFDGKRVWVQNIEKIINTLSALGYDMEKYNFYLVKPSVIRNSKLDNRDNWGSGGELLTDLLEQAKEEHHDNITKVINRYKISATSDDWREVLGSTKSNSEAKQILAEFDLYMEEINAVKETIKDLQECFRFCPNMERVESEQPEDAETRFASRFDKAIGKYPMLENVRSYYMETRVQQNCADYIDLVESK